MSRIGDQSSATTLEKIQDVKEISIQQWISPENEAHWSRVSSRKPFIDKTVKLSTQLQKSDVLMCLGPLKIRHAREISFSWSMKLINLGR